MNYRKIGWFSNSQNDIHNDNHIPIAHIYIESGLSYAVEVVVVGYHVHCTNTQYIWMWKRKVHFGESVICLYESVHDHGHDNDDNKRRTTL